jgi:hypothetical protein
MTRTFLFCDPAGARTQDPNIKSVMLYQLSYGIATSLKRWRKYRNFIAKENFLKNMILHTFTL